MEREDGYTFDCRIPPFSLESKPDEGVTPAPTPAAWPHVTFRVTARSTRDRMWPPRPRGLQWPRQHQWPLFERPRPCDRVLCLKLRQAKRVHLVWPWWLQIIDKWLLPWKLTHTPHMISKCRLFQIFYCFYYNVWLGRVMSPLVNVRSNKVKA